MEGAAAVGAAAVAGSAGSSRAGFRGVAGHEFGIRIADGDGGFVPLIAKSYTMRIFQSLEHRSLFLLVSVLAAFILLPLLETDRAGELVLVCFLSLILVAATLELSGRRMLFWSAIPMAGVCLALTVVSHFLYRTRPLQLTSSLAVAGFLGLVSTSMFGYLGRPGAIMKARLHVSVSLYFLLGIIWFDLYRVANLVQPGSFAERGVTLAGKTASSEMLYFSLATLTTLGYGDIVPVKPLARSLATLEAATGVLYIAITVARLVASLQSPVYRQNVNREETRRDS